MNNKKIILQGLKTAKVSKDKKWLYTLVAWALENETKDYTSFQRRIESSAYYAKGKYEDYWNNPKNIKQNKYQQKLCKLRNKTSNNADRYNFEKTIIINLYKHGKLSNKSEKIIEKKLKGLYERRN